MLPIKHSTIFKSRWWALAWAAGIIWTALEVSGGQGGDGGNGSANTTTAAGDPTAAQVSALMNTIS